MEIERIAIIGARKMGRTMAYCSVLAGYDTVLEDVLEDRLKQAITWIEDSLDAGLSQGNVCRADRDAAMNRLATATEVEDAIEAADLVIETVPDEMEMKLELFTIFDKFAKANAIFASNSALSVTEMSDVTVSRERCIGMRLHSGVTANHMELVKTPFTSEETLETCREVGRRMKKEIIVSQDSPTVEVPHVNRSIRS